MFLFPLTYLEKYSQNDCEWSPFGEKLLFFGKTHHFYGAIFTLGWPANTGPNPQKVLAWSYSTPLHPLFGNTGIFPSWVTATLSLVILLKSISLIYDHLPKLNRCLAGNSPRTTTTNQPTKRAPNELARPICVEEN